MYVYILSDYDEDGAENVVATLNRDNVIPLVEQNWPLQYRKAHESLSPEEQAKVNAKNKKYYEDWILEAKNKILELFKDPTCGITSRGPYNLHSGWGGMQLHVIELDTFRHISTFPKEGYLWR